MLQTQFDICCRKLLLENIFFEYMSWVGDVGDDVAGKEIRKQGMSFLINRKGSLACLHARLFELRCGWR